MPLLLVSYILTPGLKRLTIKVMGAIIPCHNPSQNPAGSASSFLYFELGPGAAHELAIIISTSLIRICFSVGNIVLHYKAAGQASPTLKKQTLARFASVRGEL